MTSGWTGLLGKVEGNGCRCNADMLGNPAACPSSCRGDVRSQHVRVTFTGTRMRAQMAFARADSQQR